MPISSDTPEAGPGSGPEKSTPENPATSQVHLSFHLKPGTRIRVTVESTAHPERKPVVWNSEPGEGEGVRSTTITIPAPAPDGAEALPGGDHENPPGAAGDETSEAPAQVEVVQVDHAPAGTSAARQPFPEGPSPFAGVMAWMTRRKLGTSTVLAGLALAVYILVRVIGLENFPIYFSCDEAVNPVLASELLHNNFRDNYNEFFPTFFKNGGQYCISTSVYLQVLPVMIFGESVFGDRLVVVLVSALGAVWIGLILRDFFKLRYWWAGILLLSVVPTWFLHSRSGYEYCLMASFYAGFAYYYLLYRYRSPRFLYPALVMGALMFYSYTPGQIVMVVTGLAVLVLDWRYHWQQRSTGLRGLGLLVLLALPLLRFMLTHPGEYINRLKMYNSFWVADLPVLKKVGLYLSSYLSGLNPFYWFFPNSKDLIRYVMRGYGNIAMPMLPFAALGLVMILKRLRLSENRLVLVMLLAAPAGGAMVGMNVTRAISFVVPVVILTALGLFAALDWLAQKWRFSLPLGAGILAAVLVVSNFAMLRDALVNGPVWYNNYGLSGMQYGASQVFPAADEYARQHPGTTVYISPNWTFQGDVLREFFVPDSPFVKIGTADAYLTTIKTDIESSAFVFIPDDFRKMQASGKFKDLQPDEVLKYPDGSPGFYFVRLHYRDDIQQIMAADAEKRRQLLTEEINLKGEPVLVSHSRLDIGPINNLFDGDLDSLVKTTASNPLVVELVFPQPHELSGVTLHVGGEMVRLTATLTGPDDDQPLVFTQDAGEVKGYKDVALDFGGSHRVSKLRLELLDVNSPDPSNVHLWEITLR